MKIFVSYIHITAT